MFVLDKRTYDILFNNAPIDDLTLDEIGEAEEDINRISSALKKVKQKFINKISRSSGFHF